MKENPKTKFDIATAFFNIEAFAMIKDNLNGVEGFRPGNKISDKEAEYNLQPYS